jgi:hypothetical protein
MVMKFAPITARRPQHDVPLGVECALPEEPAESDEEVRPKAGRGGRFVLGAIVIAFVLLLGIWRLGYGLYAHFRTQAEQLTMNPKSPEAPPLRDVRG